jgi:carboxyl-terminal processing protease
MRPPRPCGWFVCSALLAIWSGAVAMRAPGAEPGVEDWEPPPSPAAPTLTTLPAATDTPALTTLPTVVDVPGLTTLPATMEAPAAASPAISPMEPEADLEEDECDTALAALLEAARDLEREGRWNAAIDRYEDLRKAVGDLPEIGEGLERCRGHLRIETRCRNADLRDFAGRLTASRGLALYEELLERIDTSYVAETPLAPLVSRGLGNCLMALDDRLFRRTYAASPTEEALSRWQTRVIALRESCRGRDLTPADAAQVLRQMLTANAETVTATDGALVLEMTYGAMEGLDAYSAFLDPARLKALRTEIDGEFVGVGVRIVLRGRALVVAESIAGGPAAKAGVRTGDLLLAIDGRRTEGMSVSEAARLFQGPDQAAVVVELQHENQDRPVVVTVTRERVVIKSVTDLRLVGRTKRVGYLRLANFQKGTAAEVGDALKRLEKTGLDALILDLRGNPGGVVDSAVEVANAFIREGVVVTTRGRAFGQNWTFRARPEDAHPRVPLAVLVDETSASASEIVAGALRDHHRAALVGARTYGKGSVQSLFTLGKGDVGVRLTTARFYIPSGTTFDGVGLTPDLEIRLLRNSRLGEWDAEGETRDTQLASAVDYLETRLLAGATSRRASPLPPGS